MPESYKAPEQNLPVPTKLVSVERCLKATSARSEFARLLRPCVGGALPESYQ
jgi:hypothetical protein